MNNEFNYKFYDKIITYRTYLSTFLCVKENFYNSKK